MRENKEGGYKNKHKKRVALNHSAIKGGPAKITCKLVGQFHCKIISLFKQCFFRLGINQLTCILMRHTMPIKWIILPLYNC